MKSGGRSIRAMETIPDASLDIGNEIKRARAAVCERSEGGQRVPVRLDVGLLELTSLTRKTGVFIGHVYKP